jgi:seryl-tRNA synthetase
MRTALLLPLLLLLASAAPARPQGREEALQREIEELRAERNRIQDRAIEDARRYDQEKRRWLDEKEQLQRRVAELERSAAQGAPGGEAPAELPAKPVTMAFAATPLPELAKTLSEQGGVEVRAAGKDLAGLKVTLRAPELPLQAALGLVALNAVDGKGKHVELRWRVEGEAVVIERAAPAQKR